MMLPHLYSEVLPVFLLFFFCFLFFLPKQKPLNWRDAAVLTTLKTSAEPGNIGHCRSRNFSRHSGELDENISSTFISVWNP